MRTHLNSFILRVHFYICHNKELDPPLPNMNDFEIKHLKRYVDFRVDVMIAEASDNGKNSRYLRTTLLSFYLFFFPQGEDSKTIMKFITTFCFFWLVGSSLTPLTVDGNNKSHHSHHVYTSWIIWTNIQMCSSSLGVDLESEFSYRSFKDYVITCYEVSLWLLFNILKRSNFFSYIHWWWSLNMWWCDNIREHLLAYFYITACPNYFKI